ncbi:MAG: SapC family protein [Desulfococcaceae bacterium]|jgi:Fe-S-cluster containining protein|nr:SapC family protein [Desulfococcaceae bacterium]
MEKNKNRNDFIKSLSSKEHADMTFLGCDNCTMCCDGSTYTSANVLLDEMFDTAKLFPIVFSKNEEKLSLSLLYTLAKGVPCPYLDMKNRLCSVYDSVRPRACKIYPFNVRGMAASGKNLSYSLVFDSRCPGLSEKKEAGTPLLGKDGKLSQKISDTFVGENMLRNYQNNLQRTERFLHLVKEYDLLTEQQYNIVDQSDTGFYGQNTIRIWKISEEKLSALPDEAVLRFHKGHFFNAAYTHLNSLGNLNRLVKLKKEYESKRVDLLTFRV